MLRLYSQPLYIDAEEFHVHSYVDVSIESLPVQKALIDGGSEICCVNSDLIKHLNLPVSKQVRLSGLSGKSNVVDIVRLHVKSTCDDNKSVVNIAPPVRVWFAVVPDLNESVIFTPNVVALLRDVAHYNVLSPQSVSDINCSVQIDNESSVSHMAAVNVVDAANESHAGTEAATCDSDELDVAFETNDFLDVEQPQDLESDQVADTDTLRKEQRECPSLTKCWELANQNRGNFCVDDGLLYHRETILGHKVKQLCLSANST